MSISKRPPEPWDSFLKALDASVTAPVRLDCIGGFVVTNVYGSPRKTGDLDVLDASSDSDPQVLRHMLTLAGMGSPLHKKYDVYLEKVGIAPIPYEYESRLREVFTGCYIHLILLAADPYDIALSKIERNSPRDRNDVRYLGLHAPLDTEILQKRYDSELRYLLGVPKREDLTLKLWIEMIHEARAGVVVADE